MLIKNSINYVQIIPDNSKDYTNSVWIEVVNNDGKKTVIGVVYRSPNSTETNNEKLYKCIQELSNINLVIMGDLIIQILTGIIFNQHVMVQIF